MSLPNEVLTYGQMTAFVQLSINYLNLSRSVLAERYAEARGTLLLNSALSLSGINDLGRNIRYTDR